MKGKDIIRGEDIIIIEQRDSQIAKLRAETEQLNRTNRDLSSQFKLAQRFNEETIARKTKELNAVMQHKNMKLTVSEQELNDKVE
jgi:hypothetical protein